VQRGAGWGVQGSAGWASEGRGEQAAHLPGRSGRRRSGGRRGLDRSPACCREEGAESRGYAGGSGQACTRARSGCKSMLPSALSGAPCVLAQSVLHPTGGPGGMLSSCDRAKCSMPAVCRALLRSPVCALLAGGITRHAALDGRLALCACGDRARQQVLREGRGVGPAAAGVAQHARSSSSETAFASPVSRAPSQNLGPSSGMAVYGS